MGSALKKKTKTKTTFEPQRRNTWGQNKDITRLHFRLIISYREDLILEDIIWGRRGSRI